MKTDNSVLEKLCKKFNLEFHEHWTRSIYITKRNSEDRMEYEEIRISDHCSINDCIYDITRYNRGNMESDMVCVKLAILLFGFYIKGKIANKIFTDYKKDKDNGTDSIHIYRHKYIGSGLKPIE